MREYTIGPDHEQGTLRARVPAIDPGAGAMNRRWNLTIPIGFLIVLAAPFLYLAFFAYGMFYAARQLPASAGAPRVGQKAPGFTLQDTDGHPVTLARLLAPDAGAARVDGVVLIFYRGFW